MSPSVVDAGSVRDSTPPVYVDADAKRRSVKVPELAVVVVMIQDPLLRWLDRGFFPQMGVALNQRSFQFLLDSLSLKGRESPELQCDKS